MKNRHLLIISDTRIQKTDEGYYAFNSVVKELDVFVELFEKITWIGYDYSDMDLDPSLMFISYSDVRIILLKRSGGNKFSDKFKILVSLPSNAFKIIRHAVTAEVIHSRGPSVPMLVGLIFSFVYKKPKWWFKYANNWSDINPPFFWGVQKKLMIANNRSVSTVNGVWPDMPEHIKSFENPCLNEFDETLDITLHKNKICGWRLLFVGRIHEKKGYSLILRMLETISPEMVESLTIIGEGGEKDKLEKLILQHPVARKINYLGSLSNEEVFIHMLNSHFLLLPTISSEGFPKVISEAFSKGCIPITSNTSSIAQYVKHGVNGFVWEVGGDISYSEICVKAMSINEHQFHNMLLSAKSISNLFTYSRYRERIKKDILTN